MGYLNRFPLKLPSDGKISPTTCLWVKASTASTVQYFPTITQTLEFKFAVMVLEILQTLMGNTRFLPIKPYPLELVSQTILRISTSRMDYRIFKSKTRLSRMVNPCSEITNSANKIKLAIHLTPRTVVIPRSIIGDMDKISSSRLWQGTMLRQRHHNSINHIIVSI